MANCAGTRPGRQREYLLRWARAGLSGTGGRSTSGGRYVHGPQGYQTPAAQPTEVLSTHCRSHTPGLAAPTRGAAVRPNALLIWLAQARTGAAAGRVVSRNPWCGCEDFQNCDGPFNRAACDSTEHKRVLIIGPRSKRQAQRPSSLLWRKVRPRGLHVALAA